MTKNQNIEQQNKELRLIMQALKKALLRKNTTDAEKIEAAQVLLELQRKYPSVHD